MCNELMEEFNEITETIAMELWWNGLQENDGELAEVNTAWAMGVEDAT